MSFLHTHSSEFKKRTRSLFFTAYSDKHRELAMDLLQIRNIARGRRFHRIRYIQSRGRLDLTHTMLSLRIRVKLFPYQESRQLPPPT